MSQLPASALFSPSLARAHIATAKDWNYVDAWLLKRLSKPPPPFERNAETLKALLTLAAHNEAADEERELLCRLEQKALQELKVSAENDADAPLFSTMEEQLGREGQVALQTLAELSVQLNQPLPDVEKLGKKIFELQAGNFTLEQSEERISVLENHLTLESKNIRQILEDLRSDAYRPPPDLEKQTSDYQKKSKALVARLPELKEKLASLHSGQESLVTIADVKLQEDNFKEMTATVKDLETHVKSFHGLPQDTDLARLELESLRAELRSLTTQRDRMFEGLVERESPRKLR